MGVVSTSHGCAAVGLARGCGVTTLPRLGSCAMFQMRIARRSTWRCRRPLCISERGNLLPQSIRRYVPLLFLTSNSLA